MTDVTRFVVRKTGGSLDPWCIFPEPTPEKTPDAHLWRDIVAGNQLVGSEPVGFPTKTAAVEWLGETLAKTWTLRGQARLALVEWKQAHPDKNPLDSDDPLVQVAYQLVRVLDRDATEVDARLWGAG